MAEIVNRMGHTIANIRALKLRKPLGVDVGALQLDKLEFPYSHRSLQDITDNLEGIRMVYYGADDGIGLSDYLKAREIDLDEGFQERSQKCTEFIRGMSNQGSLSEAMLVDPDSVLRLADLLGDLQSYIQLELLGGLSLWLTFNDSDGD